MGNFDIPSGRTWIVQWDNSPPDNTWCNECDADGNTEYFTEHAAKAHMLIQQKEFSNIMHRIVNTHIVPTVKGDMKEGLTGGKPMLSEIPHAALVYAARGFEYGHSPGKYERGNYLRPQVDLLADFHRMQFYLDAVFRHGTKLTTEMNRALGCTDKTKEDLIKAANTVDIESGLSHLTGMLANLMMAVQQAVDAGLIPADPGQPWLKKPNSNS